MTSKTVDLNDRDFIVHLLCKDSFFINFYCFATFFTTTCFIHFVTAVYCSVAYDSC